MDVKKNYTTQWVISKSQTLNANKYKLFGKISTFKIMWEVMNDFSYDKKLELKLK